MKQIYTILSAVLAIFLLAGCENAEYQVAENSLYFADAAGKDKASIVTMENGADIKIMVRLAQKASNDVTVGLRFNPSSLEKYNADNGTEYQALPADKLPKDVEVTIPAGEISAVYTLHVDDFDTQGVNYGVPVELGEVTGASVQASVSQGQYIYLLQKPLIVSVPVMSGVIGKQVKAAPIDTDWGLTCSQWTLEAWVYMDGFNKNNQALFQTGSNGNEIYIRYGDANKPYNYLNIKTWRSQANTAKDLVKDTWYHWAFVYDGADIRVYRNGEFDFKYTPATLSSIRFDYFNMIASGGRYFIDDCSMSQVRLWSVARSQTEIQNNMYFAVNPKNPNLIALWPMDEGEGGVFKDVTENGHDAIAGEGIMKGWKHNIRFDK